MQTVHFGLNIHHFNVGLGQHGIEGLVAHMWVVMCLPTLSMSTSYTSVWAVSWNAAVWAAADGSATKPSAPAASTYPSSSLSKRACGHSQHALTCCKPISSSHPVLRILQ